MSEITSGFVGWNYVPTKMDAYAGLSAKAKVVVNGVFDRANATTNLKATVQDMLLLPNKAGYKPIIEAGEALRTLDDSNKAYQVLVSTVSQVTLESAGWPATMPKVSLQRDKKTGRCTIGLKKERNSSARNVLTKALGKEAERLADQVNKGDDVTSVMAKFLAQAGLTADDVILIADIMENGEVE